MPGAMLPPGVWAASDDLTLIMRARPATAWFWSVAKSPVRSSSSAEPIWRRRFESIRAIVSCTPEPLRRKLPCTTIVAPSSRRADVGSLTLRLRTTLAGTTQSDC